MSEQFPTRGGSYDGRVTRASRLFTVAGTTDTVFSNPAVPRPGSSFTYNSRVLRADRVEVRPSQAAGYSDVEVVYSNDGSGKLPPRRDDHDLGFRTYEMGFVRSTMRVPAFRRKLVIDDPGDPPPAAPTTFFHYEWEPFDFEVDHWEADLRVVVNVERFGEQEWALIAAQIGAIHEFGPAVGDAEAHWQFRGAQISNKAGDLWQLTYSWVHDPGHAAMTVPDAQAGTLILPSDPRPSFHRWVVVPADEIDGLPTITSVLPFRFVGDGQQTLPGDPI